MITIREAKKSFGELDVLRGITAEVTTGEITGLIGPNGCGKSTLLKSVLGLVRLDSGCITVSGLPAGGSHEYRAAIGYMPQHPCFPANLTVAELRDMMEDLRPISGEPDLELWESFHLDRERGKKIGTLSGGTCQKLNAAIAFMFRPSVFIIDEPTASLDPVAACILKDKIAAERNAGKTVLVTSHVMAEIEELADRVIFMADGRIHFQDTVERIKAVAGQAHLDRAIVELMRTQWI